MHLRRYAWPGLSVVRDLIFVFFGVDIVWRCSASCAQTPELFPTFMCLFNCQRKNKKIIYANVYRNTINRRRFTDASSPDFSWGRGGRLYTGYIYLWEERRKKEASFKYWAHLPRYERWMAQKHRQVGIFRNIQRLLFEPPISALPIIAEHNSSSDWFCTHDSIMWAKFGPLWEI